MKQVSHRRSLLRMSVLDAASSTPSRNWCRLVTELLPRFLVGETQRLNDDYPAQRFSASGRVCHRSASAAAGSVGIGLSDAAGTFDLRLCRGWRRAEPFVSSPDEFARFNADYTERWAKVIRAANIRAE